MNESKIKSYRSKISHKPNNSKEASQESHISKFNDSKDQSQKSKISLKPN